MDDETLWSRHARRYRVSVPVPGDPKKPITLPWPMTNLEAFGYLAGTYAMGLGLIGAGVWVSLEFIGPSLLRLVPPALAVVLVKWVVVPSFARSLAPSDLARRRAAAERQEQRLQEPPAGGAR